MSPSPNDPPADAPWQKHEGKPDLRASTVPPPKPPVPPMTRPRPPPAGRQYLPARLTWERYNVSCMTLNRWIASGSMGFPKPIYFGRFRYFDLAELEEWERRSPRGRTRAEAA